MATVWSKVKVVGPLTSYAERFGRTLTDLGYTDLSTGEQLRLMGHLSRWMASQGLGVAALGGSVETYCEARRAEGYTARLTPSSLERLLRFLRDEGVLCEPPATGPVGPDAQLVARYQAWLVGERGLVDQVVANWVKLAAAFVADHPGFSTGVTVIRTAEVTVFLARELPRRTPSPARNLAAAPAVVPAVLAPGRCRAGAAGAGGAACGLPQGRRPASLPGARDRRPAARQL